MTHLPSPLALLVGGGVLGLSLVGAGVYALAPLAGGDAEAEARAVAEAYVAAWGETRCEDAAALIEGPREEVLARCRRDAGTRLRGLRITGSTVDLDGGRGTARLEVTFRKDGELHTEEVRESVVRVDGTWLVAWDG